MAKRKQIQKENTWASFKGSALLTDPLNSLSRTFIPAERICRVFEIDDKKDIDSYLLRFQEINRENLEFLDISSVLSTDSAKKGIYLETSQYAGAIPIKSPKNGKFTVDLLVKGRYSSDVDEDDLTGLLTTMGETMLPRFHDSLRLCGESVKPPIFFECQNFIDSYIKAEKEHWTKFANEIRIEKTTRSSTNWTKYALNSYNPNKVLVFENKINFQTTDHKEWRQLIYVLDFCIQELSSGRTPQKTRRLYADKLCRLRKTYNKYQIEKTSFIPIHATDPIAIKKLKKIANIILKDTSTEKRSWRIDIAVLFERYVQFVFDNATNRISWKVRSNPHYPVHGWKPRWSLNYLEPDLILQSFDSQIVIDAKYKSHMLSSSDNNGEKQKEAFREDLFQVLAYSAFNRQEKKYVILTYPYNVNFDNSDEENNRYTRIIEQRITSPFSSSNVEVILLSLPFTNNHLGEVINEISELVNRISAEADYLD